MARFLLWQSDWDCLVDNGIFTRDGTGYINDDLGDTTKRGSQVVAFRYVGFDVFQGIVKSISAALIYVLHYASRADKGDRKPYIQEWGGDAVRRRGYIVEGTRESFDVT